MAREARDLVESYRAALAFGMQAAWAQVKVARDTQAVIAGLAHRAYSPRYGPCGPSRKANLTECRSLGVREPQAPVQLGPARCDLRQQSIPLCRSNS